MGDETAGEFEDHFVDVVWPLSSEARSSEAVQPRLSTVSERGGRDACGYEIAELFQSGGEDGLRFVALAEKDPPGGSRGEVDAGGGFLAVCGLLRVQFGHGVLQRSWVSWAMKSRDLAAGRAAWVVRSKIRR